MSTNQTETRAQHAPAVSYPAPGETKWDASGPTHEDASRLAAEHWDVIDVRCSTQGGTWDVVSRSGFVALIGKINGSLAILNKLGDGSRELRVYAPPSQTITPTEHEKREWSRLAQAAYAADRNDIGHRFSGAAALRVGEAMLIATFDALQADYRAWLTYGEFFA